MQKNRIIAIIFLLLANLIYGLNFSIAKIPMKSFVQPFAFVLLRCIAAVVFFWIIASLVKDWRTVKMPMKDLGLIFLCALFGVCLNQLLFFKGLALTTPISGAIIMTLSPVMVFVLSFFILKEKITPRKRTGVVLALLGAVILIWAGNELKQEHAKNPILGNLLVFINGTSYALYLILVKPLLQKYPPIVVLKWLFLFGMIWVFPFSIGQLMEVKWQNINPEIFWSLAFVLIFTSCLTYLFNIFGLKDLKPSSVGVFIYFQPLFATFYALFMGMDHLDMIKIPAAMFIFGGVYLVVMPGKKSKQV